MWWSYDKKNVTKLGTHSFYWSRLKNTYPEASEKTVLGDGNKDSKEIFIIFRYYVPVQSDKSLFTTPFWNQRMFLISLSLKTKHTLSKVRETKSDSEEWNSFIESLNNLTGGKNNYVVW